MIDISIVVPVYNVEKYLHKCIDSLLNQTFKNIEIILVEDCSTDKSKIICREYASRFRNISLVCHSENKGLAQARNTGMMIAKGEFIAFVDSDDWVATNMYKLMYEKIIKDKLDIVVCGFEEKYQNGKKSEFTFRFEENIYDNTEVLKKFLSGEINAIAWNKLYKICLFKEYNIKYPVGKLYEDQYPTFLSLFNSNAVGIINKPLYYYRKIDTSITGSKFSKRDLDIIEQTNNIKKYLENKNQFENYKDYYQIRYINNISTFVINKLIKSKNFFECISLHNKYIKKDFKVNTNGYLINKKLNKKNKIKIFLIRNLFTLYLLVLKIR